MLPPLFRNKSLPRSLAMPMAVSLACLFLANGALADTTSDYRIKPQTKLKVTIVEWMSGTGEYKEWTALNGEFSVSPRGSISVPMLGEIPVAEKTTADVEAAISRALKDKIGLTDVPVATVEVTRYPMIYVTGAVDRSGEFEYRPGMTVTQAVAVAGGRERRQMPTGGYSEADQIRYYGELNRYQLLLRQLSAKRARLQAEVDEKKAVTPPPELAGADASTKRILEEENMLFLARTQALRHHLDSLDDLAEQLKNEIELLDQKKAVQERQVKIAEEELAVVSKLVDTKTLAKARELSSERTLAELRSDMLDLVMSGMRAKQKLSETERDGLTLKGQYIVDARRDLQEVEAEIDDTKLKRDTMLQVLQITGATLSRIDDLKAVEVQPLQFWVTHAGEAQAPMQVSETTALAPGDVLEVRLDLTAQAGDLAGIVPRQTQ